MWSKTKKKLESLICSSLKERVKFFVTNYTDAHDQSGRACILVDGKEMFNMCCYRYQVEKYKIECQLIRDKNYVPKYQSEYSASWEAAEIADEKGIHGNWHFYEAITAYLAKPIDISLESENEIMQSLALMDRRVGKRTLSRLRNTMEVQAEMVKYFYNLRCEAEGLPTLQKESLIANLHV